MCSVTWGHQTGQTVIHCSRDEQRQRPPGLPPQHFLEGGVHVIAPIDPAGGGTWLWANEHGIVATLLNFYDAIPPHDHSPTRSRGLLLKGLAASPSAAVLFNGLEQALQQHTFAPFWIVAWPPGQDPSHWSWDGSVLKSHTSTFADLPFSSSSWNTEQVLEERKRLFREQFPTAPSDPETLRQFHLSISSQGPEWGPLMTRARTQTVSLTQITVCEADITMAYQSRLDSPEATVFSTPTLVQLPRHPSSAHS